MDFNKYFSIAKHEVSEAIIDNKGLILLMTLVFVISAVVGWIFQDYFSGFFKYFVEAVKTSGVDPSLDSSLNLFINNEGVGLKVYFASIFFGIAPFVVMVLNGLGFGLLGGHFITGDIFYKSVLFIALIVPHGIFEIPATIFESAAGVLLFLFIFKFFKTIPSMNDSSFKLKAKSSWEVNKIHLKQSIVLMIFSCVLLVIAAIIEGHITPAIGMFVKSLF